MVNILRWYLGVTVFFSCKEEPCQSSKSQNNLSHSWFVQIQNAENSIVPIHGTQAFIYTFGLKECVFRDANGSRTWALRQSITVIATRRKSLPNNSE